MALMPINALAHTKREQSIIDAVRRNPCHHVGTLAATLGLTVAYTRRVVEAMEARGVLTREVFPARPDECNYYLRTFGASYE